jgi:hypothetical protein
MMGEVIGYAGGNVPDETDILLSVPCEICEHCGALAVIVELR